jgi:hypothetical protein
LNGYYRLILPGHALTQRGHKVAVDASMPKWVQDGGCDVIVAQRTCNEGATGLWQKLARAGHSKLVFEIDDDLWHIEPSNTMAHRFYDEAHRGRLIDNITVADLVTVTTEPLADLVSQWNPNVAILPNCVPQWMIDQPMPVQQTERVTLGWGGSPSHTRDFGEVAKPLKRVLQRFGDATEFHCMGPDFTDRVTSLKGRTRHTDWFHGVEDYLRAVDFQIGVIPLRPSVFNDAKSDLKLAELSALGIPAIVSHTGPYARAVDSGAPARTATDHKAWERELVDLIQSPSDRETLGKEAREWAATRVIDQHAHLWEEAYS